MVRKAVIDQVGPLNERWFYSVEVEWCRRICAAGWKIFCVPTAVIEHVLSASTRQRDDEHILPITAMRDYFIFLRKPSRFSLLLFDVTNLAGLLARATAFRLIGLFDRTKADIWRSRARYFTRLLCNYAQIAFVDKKIE
jgi:GT2 family glycosyltransferase